MAEDAKHSTRVAIISACVSLALSVVFAAYIVGQRTGKVLEIESWKKRHRTAHREDGLGRISGNQEFHQALTRLSKPSNTNDLKHLEDEVNHLDKMELRIDRLEGKLGKDP